MLDAKDTQFRLGEYGVISFQAQESNPLPGTPVAKLVRGDHPLAPKVQVTHQSGAALTSRLEDWWAAHMKVALEPLAALQEENAFKPHVQAIIARMYDAMGILPREDLAEFIKDLEAEDRGDLRSKHIRLGPILVFIPALNKPAMVRLRAMLWALYHGQGLPAPILPAQGVPNDGIVSMPVDESANKDFYQAIGYPVYGGRAVRIDMLDRVICEVYDSADKGKFQAQHKMAEWLGCGLEDLYSVLSAMGHVRIAEEGEVAEGEKPPLGWFHLKKGKGGAAKKAPMKKAKPKPEKNAKKKSGKRNKEAARQPKIMSAGPKPKPEDSPFAVLEQLKSKKQ